MSSTAVTTVNRGAGTSSSSSPTRSDRSARSPTRSSWSSRRSRSTCRCCGTSASSPCGATAGETLYRTNAERCARFTTGAGCSPGTGADSSGASRHTRRRNDDNDAPGLGEPDVHDHRRNHRPRVARADVRSRSSRRWDGSTKRRTARRCRWSSSRTRRPLVSRPGRRQRPPVGFRAEHQAARRCSRSGARCSCRPPRPRT